MKHANAIEILREANAAGRLTEDEFLAAEKDMVIGGAIYAQKTINLDGQDWVLKGEGKEPVASTWITVGNVSLKVTRDQHSMHVVALPLGQEMHDPPLAEFTLWFSDVQGCIDDASETACERKEIP